MAKKNQLDFDGLCNLDSLDRLRDELAVWPVALSLPQIQRLAARARDLTPVIRSLRLAIVHTYTSDLLDPWLDYAGALAGFELETYHAPYGLDLRQANAESALLLHKPDITLLMLKREDLHPDLAQPLTGLSEQQRSALQQASLDRVAEIVGRFRAQSAGQIVLTLLPGITAPTLGLFDRQAETSDAEWWATFDAALSAWIRQSSQATLYLDLQDVANHVGKAQFFDRRYWHSAQFPFTRTAAQEFTQRVVAVATVLKSPKAKVIVLDADNTLWGGVIGEDGMDGIALGPEYPGNAYREFQRRLLDFQQRGFVLALCSKNNAADVDEVLKNHPHQILRESHFAAKRVNWLDKSDNLQSLALELNLGLDSFVFVDDSDHECAAVKNRLPQVQVVQVPSRPVDVAICLDRVARLEILSLTVEDKKKTEMYAQDRVRQEALRDVGGGADSGEYLMRLGMKMRITVAPQSHLNRLSQLTKKTNQFNLTTRRYDENQIQERINQPDWLVADFSLADTFGDSGIVGLAMFQRLDAETAELDTLLMSCRVIGRQAEFAFVNELLRRLRSEGIKRVVADYAPSAKNQLVENLLPTLGFESRPDGRFERNVWTHPAAAPDAFPIEVTVVSS